MTTVEGDEDIRLGELLYPSFNTVVPLMCEELCIAKASKCSFSAIDSLTTSLWDLLEFAFKEKIFTRLADRLSNSRQMVRNLDIEDFLDAKEEI